MTRELSNAPDALLTIESEMKRLKDELYGEQGIGGIARELQGDNGIHENDELYFKSHSYISMSKCCLFL